MSLTAYSSMQTVIGRGNQNAPPCFLETTSGKMLFFYCGNQASHGSKDGDITLKTATNEAAANAGTFSSATTLVAHDATYGYQPGGAMQIREGANAGRIWLSFLKWRTSGAQLWATQLIYSDDDGVTWSSPSTVTSPFSGTSTDALIEGTSPVAEIVEVPGTSGLELLLPILGFTGGQPYESVKLVASTDGGSTWSQRSVIHAPEATRAPSEPCAKYIRRSNGALRLMVTVNYWNASGATTIYTKYSDDNGATWSASGAGTTIASSATAPPAFVQAKDGSLIVVYRNLASGENAWLIRSTDYGATWGNSAVLDTDGRYRYGQFGNLLSGRIGLCWGMETIMGGLSTAAGVYWKSFYSPRFVSGSHGRRRGVTRARL